MFTRWRQAQGHPGTAAQPGIGALVAARRHDCGCGSLNRCPGYLLAGCISGAR